MTDKADYQLTFDLTCPISDGDGVRLSLAREGAETTFQLSILRWHPGKNRHVATFHAQTSDLEAVRAWLGAALHAVDLELKRTGGER